MLSCYISMTIVIYIFFIYIYYNSYVVFLRIFSEIGGGPAILVYGSLVFSFMAFLNMYIENYLYNYSDE